MIDEESYAIYQKWHLRNESKPREFNPWLSDQRMLDILGEYAGKIERGQHKVYGVNTHFSKEVSTLVFANLSPGFHAVALDPTVINQEDKGTVLRIYLGYFDKTTMIEEMPSLLELLKKHTFNTEVKFLVDAEAFPRSDAVTVYVTGGISNLLKFSKEIQIFGNYDKRSLFTVPIGECVTSILELPSMGQTDGLSYGLFCAQLIQRLSKELNVEADSLIGWLTGESGFWIPKEVRNFGNTLEDWTLLLTDNCPI